MIPFVLPGFYQYTALLKSIKIKKNCILQEDVEKHIQKAHTLNFLCNVI